MWNRRGGVAGEVADVGIEVQVPTFDVDVLVLFPVALAYNEPWFGIRDFVEILVFVGILLLAIVFAWRKGAFSWKQ